MAENNLNESSRYLYWDSLHYIDPALKNARWMAECILFAKYNSNPLISAEIAKDVRDKNKGKIDEKAYKEILDPKLPDGSGGEAEYFAADWKANPIFVHLDNIVEANIEKIPANIYVKAADEFAKLKMQKENDKIISRKYVENFISEMNHKIGLPPLGKEDPYRFINKMNSGQKGDTGKAFPITAIDSIKSAVEDDEDLALFNEQIYKDGVEIAIELGIDHYLNENKYARIAEKTVQDIKNFNCAVSRYYTSKTTGRPMIQYYEPWEVFTSSFKKADLSDITFWWAETDVSFADFMRMMGADIKKQCKDTNRAYDEVMKEIFDLNRTTGAAHGLRYDNITRGQRDNAKVRIGYIEMESQDFEVYSERTIRGNVRFRKEPSDFKVTKDMRKKYNAKREERYYNVWYGAYYIPATVSSSVVQTTTIDEQAKYIFDFRKVQDQQREGDDFKYAKCSLVGWKSNKMTFFEIMDAYMPKINLLWFHFQNNLANAMPHGIIFAEEAMNQMMSATDDANKKGADSGFEKIRQMKQTGYGAFKFLTDTEGKPINDGKPFVEVKTGHIASARENLILMQELYNMMTQALGISDIREGLDPKPRTSLGAIQMSTAASNNATFFIEKAYIDITLEHGRRLMYYFKEIVESGDSERLNDFMDVVGRSNAMALESIKEIPMHRLGLNVYNIMTGEEKQRLLFIADKMAAAGQIDPDTVLFISRVDNLKYGEAILRLKYKQKQKELAAIAAQNQQYIMQQKQMDLQIEMAKIGAKSQGEANVWTVIKGWDERIKELELTYKKEGQERAIEMRGENKKEEAAMKDELARNKELTKPLV